MQVSYMIMFYVTGVLLMTSGNYASLLPSPDRCWTWHRTERKERRTYMLSIHPTDHFLLNNVENLVIQLGDSKICDSQVSMKKIYS